MFVCRLVEFQTEYSVANDIRGYINLPAIKYIGHATMKFRPLEQLLCFCPHALSALSLSLSPSAVRSKQDLGLLQDQSPSVLIPSYYSLLLPLTPIFFTSFSASSNHLPRGFP